MSSNPKIAKYTSVFRLVERLRDDLDNKALFENILQAFLARYQFDLPKIITDKTQQVNQP